MPVAELHFYTNPQSRGRIVRWMLEETGLDYDTTVLEYGTSMKSAAYLAINPMGKVPAIVHKGTVVTEAAAICAYLADLCAPGVLAPAVADPARGTYYRWLFYGAGPLEMAVTARALGWEVPPERQGMVGFGSHGTVLDVLERAVSGGPWLCGEQFTAADVYTGSGLVWGLQFGTVEQRPAFVDYAARLVARPAAKRAQALDDALLNGR